MNNIKRLQITGFVILILLMNNLSTTAQISFSTQSSYKFIKGNQAQSLASDWVNSGFDDSSWQISNAPFRYGDGTGGTELTDMQGNYSTVFLRSSFNAQNIDSLGDVLFAVNWDDGFVLFVNGKEVFRQQAPTSISYDALASGQHESGTPENFTFDLSDLELVEGENTIAVFACNVTLDESSDFYFDVAISSRVTIPDMAELIDTVGLIFSSPSGFYDSNFDLSINSPLSGVSIVYTLDGSNPQTSFSSVTSINPATISINPNSDVNRGTTPGVVVRASVIKEGYKASKPTVRTFIYPDKVKTQSHPGYDWPTYDVNGQYIDLNMDSKVVNSSQYSDQIENALTDISTISVVTDNANLFDSQTGIYVNAEGQGAEWERECSVELINPDGSDGFNVNAGLRIRGGWSRHDDFPKHAFRLFFREEYGDSKLYYPLFGDEGVDRFDKVDLRCAQNYSWCNSSGEHNTFIREVFCRDAQGETGQPYTRSRYYHLYLNGLYWGVFQTQERSEARYASDYFGGDNEDYDVIKRSGDDYSSELVATDGNMDKWREVYNLTNQGYSGNSNYFKLEGKDANGKPIKNSEILVNIDNLIDYMINIFYSGNFDAPVSKFGQNKSPNNMYAITNREDKSSGFVFLVHDAEHSLMVDPTGPGIGLYENRVNIGELDDDYRMEIWGFEGFHIQWLHHRLSDNDEYQIRFADRAMKRLSGNGIFTADACINRLDNRAAQIDMAVIAESARWGDSKTGDFAFTKDNAWLPELEVLRNDYFPFRADIVIDQLMDLDLYSTISAPVVKQNGETILDEKVYISSATSITLNQSSGEIYYTLNGTDPRKIGGEINSKAIKVESGASISIPQSAVLKARVLKNGQLWSALREIDFVADQTDYSKFKVTELHYHPTDSIVGSDTTSGKSYEFIEFRNTGYVSAINLSGLYIDEAINYEFPDDELLAPGQYFVVAAKPKKFYDRYGLVSTGNNQNTFANSGEQILIKNRFTSEVVMDFTYSDDLPWPIEADGEGSSLSSVKKSPIGDPNDWDYWMASKQLNGSPFTTDGIAVGVEDDELFSSIDFSALFRLYPNPTQDEVFIQYDGLENDDFTLRLYDIDGSILFTSSYYSKANISLESLNLNAGVYILTIEKENQIDTRKVIYTPR